MPSRGTLAEIALVTFRMRIKKNNYLQLIYAILLLLGIIFSVLIPGLTNITLIDSIYIFILYLISGIILFALLRRFTRIVDFSEVRLINIFLQYLFGVIMFGGIISFLFLYINQHYPLNENNRIVQTKILGVSYEKLRHRKRTPYVDILIDDYKKRIYLEKTEPIWRVKNIEVNLKKGLFSYNFISGRNIELTDDK